MQRHMPYPTMNINEMPSLSIAVLSCLVAVIFRHWKKSAIMSTPSTAISTSISSSWNFTLHDPSLALGSAICTIDTMQESELTLSTFLETYWRQKPLLLLRDTDDDPSLPSLLSTRTRTTKQHLLEHYGDVSIPLAGYESYAFRQEQHMTLREYLLDDHFTAHTNYSVGNQTSFSFATDYFDISKHYRVPQILHQLKEAKEKQHRNDHDYTFDWHFQVALAASGAGLNFHWHADVFAETLQGRRRWFLMPPEHSPRFNPRQTSAAWFHQVYAVGETHSNVPLEFHESLQECTLEPGQVLYVPLDWFHATLSLGQAVSISTSLASVFRQERYDETLVGTAASLHARMLDALERQDYPTALAHAAKMQQARPSNFAPFQWRGVLETLYARTFTTANDIFLHLQRALEATRQCIALNPYYAACHVWARRQCLALATLVTDDEKVQHYQNEAVRHQLEASRLSSDTDDEILDPRWQPRHMKRSAKQQQQQ